MTPTDAALAISGGGLVLSLGGALAIVAVSYGRLQAEVQQLKASRADLVTKADITPLQNDVQQIKGMFRLVLRPDSIERIEAERTGGP